MFLFGRSLSAHNPFLGYDGDFDEAASSCFKTATIFLVLSAVSMASFVVSAVRTKMGSAPAISGGEYQSV